MQLKTMKDINSKIDRTSLTKLIEKFRECKTAAGEREYINRERAAIRNEIKDSTTKEKSESIMKLIWMNMMGYETEFSQIECMNALFSENFQLKSVGYLGLALFLSEESEVLMMATNRIRLDLELKSDDFTQALALRTFSEIADIAMVHDLSKSIRNLLQSSSKYVKKKAIMSLIRVLNKDPSFADELIDVYPNLLNEKNQGLLLCTLQLGQKLLKIKPGLAKPIIAKLDPIYSILRSLSTKYESNYTVNGINDPFIQCVIVDFLKDLCLIQEDLLPEFSTQLLMIYNNIHNTTTNTGRCLLYQIARSIMQVGSSNSLKKIAISILGSFLDLKNKNFLFASLNMLLFASVKYKDEIAKYDKIILKCAKEKDFTIKKIAIKILKNISNSENSTEILNILTTQILNESNKLNIKELMSISISIIERGSVDLVSLIDRYFLVLAAIKVSNCQDMLDDFFNLMSNSRETQSYLILRCVLFVWDKQNSDKETLLRVCFWVFGEFYGRLNRIVRNRKRCL